MMQNLNMPSGLFLLLGAVAASPTERSVTACSDLVGFSVIVNLYPGTAGSEYIDSELAEEERWGNLVGRVEVEPTAR